MLVIVQKWLKLYLVHFNPLWSYWVVYDVYNSVRNFSNEQQPTVILSHQSLHRLHEKQKNTLEKEMLKENTREAAVNGQS